MCLPMGHTRKCMDELIDAWKDVMKTWRETEPRPATIKITTDQNHRIVEASRVVMFEMGMGRIVTMDEAFVKAGMTEK